MSVLQVSNVSKAFKGRLVLNDVTFSVDSGEILGFIGPNGAGKTTAIKVILGLLRADSGKVSIFGRDVEKEHTLALKSVGAIIESPELYSYLSGYDNLMQYARIYGIGEDRVLECAETVGLRDRIKDKVSKYSLGMRQRLGVAQAIMHKPGLLILDEPTNGLDPNGILDLRATLRSVAAEGTAVLVSSHLLSELEHICNSVCIIERGVVVSRRRLDPEQLAEQPLTYVFTVNDSASAANILGNAGFSGNIISPESLSAVSLKEDIPKAVSLLVSAGISVYSLVERKFSIEDAYLQATGVAGKNNEGGGLL